MNITLVCDKQGSDFVRVDLFYCGVIRL